MLFSAYDTPTILSIENALRACVASSWREDVQKQSHYILVYKGEKRVAIRNNLLVTPKVKKAESLSDPSLVFWCGVMVICARLYADRCSEQTFVGTIKKMIRLPKTKHHRSSCNRTPPMEMEASAELKCHHGPTLPWGTILKRHRGTARTTTSSGCHVRFSPKEPLNPLLHLRLSKHPHPFLRKSLSLVISIQGSQCVVESGLFPLCIGPYCTSATQNSAS